MKIPIIVACCAAILAGVAAADQTAPKQTDPKRRTPAIERQLPAMKVVDSAHLRTGVVIEVRMRPTKPIESEDEPVSWAPLADAVIVVADADNRILGRVRSDSTGRVFLQLLPGTHYFRPQRIGRAMFPHPLESKRAYVSDGQVVNVLLEYDTGIR